MERVVEAGAQVSIVSGGTVEALPVEAAVLGGSDACLFVRLGSPAPESFPAVAIAVVGRGVSQHYARVDVTRSSPTEWSLRVAAPWQRPMDQRGEPRYPAHIAASVRAAAPQRDFEARLLDVSRTGAAIQVDDWDDQETFDVTMECSGTLIALRCRAAEIERRWNGVVLHCTFVDVSLVQTVALEELTASLRGSFKAAQRYLAGRIDDP